MVNHKIMRRVAIGLTVVAVPVAIVVGNVGMSAINPYYKYYRTPITGDNSGFISAYLSAVYRGAEAIVAPGFTHKTPIEALYNSKEASKVKNTGFLLLDEAIDYVYEPKELPNGDTVFVERNGSDGQPLLSNAIKNTASITFRADLGSIQTGVAVAEFLNENIDTFGPDLTFGMYGGLPFSSVTSFMGGMQKGIEWFNKNVVGKNNAVSGQANKKITIVGPKNITNNFAGGFGPGDGDSIINTYLQEPDLDAFMPIAGPQVWTAQKKIMELNKKTILIGVDSPCEDNSLNLPLKFKGKDGKVVGNGKYVQFSSEKNLAKATNNMLTIVNNGNKVPDEFKDTDDYKNFHDTNGVGGLGTVSVGDATNKCVGVSPTGEKFLQNALTDSGLGVDKDPSKDAQYSVPANMTYQYAWTDGTAQGAPLSYADLRQEFKNVLAPGSYSKDSGTDVQAVNLCPDGKPFIQKGVQEDENKVKLILSDPTSILFDGSFAESSYLGMVEFYKTLGITIPTRKAGK